MPKKNNKFYNFSEYNPTTNSTDFYIYGEIISGGSDWKWDDSEVCFEDMRDALDNTPDNSILNMYINTPGGSVTTTQGMVAMLDRAKNRGVTINAYVDGISASCGSWLMCKADNLYVYSQSIIMIHKPSCFVAGNAEDMKKQIEILDKIENDVIIPLYMDRVKDGITEDDIRNYMAEETWFTANEFIEVFDNVTLLKDNKQIACCVSKDIMKNYTNIPDNIKELLNKQDNSSNIKNNDNSKVENESKEGEEGMSVEEIKDDNLDSQEGAENKENEVIENQEENVESVENVEGEEVEDEENSEENSEEDSEENEEVTDENSETTNKVVLELMDKLQKTEELVANMKPMVDEYLAIKQKEKEKELENKISEKKDYYKNKFEMINAIDKFNSDEIQNLIKDCIDNVESENKLNQMIVDGLKNKQNEEDLTCSVISNSRYFNKEKEVDNLINKGVNEGCASYFRTEE